MKINVEAINSENRCLEDRSANTCVVDVAHNCTIYLPPADPALIYLYANRICFIRNFRSRLRVHFCHRRHRQEPKMEEGLFLDRCNRFEMLLCSSRCLVAHTHTQIFPRCSLSA